MARSWFERLLSSIADRGRAWIRVPTDLPPLEQALALAANLVSERGEASGAALARALLDIYHGFGEAERLAWFDHLAGEYAPDPARLRAAAEAYLAEATPATAAALAEAADPPRQELLRRLNMGPQGTAALVVMREQILALLPERPHLAPLESDLRHLLASWFNRGFLELRRIDWNTPAAVLEKLMTYEAVHAVRSWADLRRRLAPDRRCFAFFHPALNDDPLIFVEVALENGLAGAIEPLLRLDGGAAPAAPDTAIFYSISNCQRGLRGISFGNFLIKQVVEELKAEVPSLTRFATLSPVPGFRRWLDRRLGGGSRNLLRAEERPALVAAAGGPGAKGAFRRLLAEPGWPDDPVACAALEAPLTRLCAEYLTATRDGGGPADPVARFHLGNGARLERIDWLGNPGARGMGESYGLMVNYLYDLDRIEANHEAFLRQGVIAHSPEVAGLLRSEAGGGSGVGGLLNFGAVRRG